jgi:hypothetical protein
VATAVGQGADIVTRITPATFPVETAAGEPFDLLAWLGQSPSPALEWQGWCVYEAQRYAIRVLAVRLPPEVAARARQRKYQQAQKKGRTPSAATVMLADWVLVVTTLASDWTLEEVMRLYRARWQVELVFKRMKQLLHLNQVRSTHRDAVEATIRALLVAWALQEDLVADIRAHLATPPPVRPMVVSTWLLGGLGVETLRQQVHGAWSQARVQHCLPRLRRFLCSRPRRRVHQETMIRAWLEGRRLRQAPAADAAA